MSQRRFITKSPKPTVSEPAPSVSDDKPDDSPISTPPAGEPSAEEPVQPSTDANPTDEQPTDGKPPADQPTVDPPTGAPSDSDGTSTATPAAVPEPDAKDTREIQPIDLTKQADYESIHLTTSQTGRNSYIVQLQSDASQADREAHIRKVRDLCQKSDPPLAGIEAVLDTVIAGYVGVFDDAVLREIWKSKPTIVHSIVQNQQAEIYGDTLTTTTMNWGASRISSDSNTSWKQIPESGNLWPYRKSSSEKDGEGTIFFLIDQGEFCQDDFKRSDHLISNHPDANDKSHSHPTMMANVMSGETFGLAPQAKFWLFNAFPKLTKVAVLLAFETISKMNLDDLNIKKGGGILCLPFGFPNCQKTNHPLAAALDYLMKVKNLKIVTATPNRQEYVVEYDSFPQNVDELILVGGSCEHNKLARCSGWSEKISLYAPAIDIPILNPKLDLDTTIRSSENAHIKKGVGQGNCFGAAHVCGVISLIMSDDDAASTQEEMKDALMKHFSIVTDYVGHTRVPIRVLKKFIQVHQPTKPQLSQPGSRAVSGTHKTGTGSASTLLIRQSSSGGCHVLLAGRHDRVSAKLSSVELGNLLNKLQSRYPDYAGISRIFEKDPANYGRDIRAIFEEISKVEVTFSWNVRSPTLSQLDTDRDRLRSVVWNAMQLDEL